jgi:DNA-directed RNA polymerase subunit RPC12/RpoP
VKVALKCGNCGHIDIDSGSDETVAFEIDFLEKKIIYICSQCKKNNTILLESDSDSKPTGLPRIKVMR